MIAFISVYDCAEPVRSMYERLLYKLLAERKPYQNISHKKMPSFDNHVEFVRGKPYKHWYLVQDIKSQKFVGSVYITHQNELGIFLFEEFMHKGYGKEILDSMYQHNLDIKYFRVNIALTNSHSLAFFINQAYKYESTLQGVQYTYRKTNPYYVDVSAQDASQNDDLSSFHPDAEQ